MPGSPHPSAARRFRHGSPHPSAMQDASGPDGDEEQEQEPPAPAPEVAKEELPELLSIGPSIFVPAKFDYTTPPPDLPPDTVTRVRQHLADLDAHTAAVKANIKFLVEREARRIHREAIKAEEAHLAQGLPPERSKRLGPSAANEAAMIRSLEAPAQTGQSYGVPASFGYAEVPVMPLNPKDTTRERATTQMFNLMRYGVQNLEGYEQHVINVRNARMDRIRREVVEETARKLARSAGDDNMEIE